MNFGDWLKSYMKENKLTLQDLEDMTGFSKANLSLWARGRKPQLKTVEKIMEALECEVIYRPIEPINVYEKIQRCSKIGVATVLCNMHDCDNCPASDYCYKGHNGFIHILEGDE